ncbi:MULTISPECIES: XRE family transcriptional regulator [Acinetobacter]|uniref:Phage repressor protein C, contains Cro/C1-type HTH and peptisase s24 domains n=1 Tax=Acinetobacter kyonggiensis TaxID=595670 RepID=A0A1H3GRK7_9GAMM|nr:helix-turn-helix domain-containing protein [Acinetobacter kyonggiensis]SDY05953.1 Phage repressor protein C, contains Cro/C1-type HTH and peptisase s24 domains [Acinetobacter kyonggiensis]
MNTLANRLKEARLKANKTQGEVADAAGIKQPTYQALESGKTKKSSYLPEIAKFLEVDVDWLKTGKESNLFKTLSFNEIKKKFGGSKTDLSDQNIGINLYTFGDPVPEGYTAIDYYPEIKASAGNGYINLEESSPYKLFIPNVEILNSGACATHCKIINVDGESMMPDLYPEQKISIDMSAKKIYDGEIYAFTKGSELKIKILFNWGEEGQGGFRAVSRNSDKVRYPDEYYSPAQIESENIQIIGQYWWKSEIRKVRR